MSNTLESALKICGTLLLLGAVIQTFSSLYGSLLTSNFLTLGRFDLGGMAILFSLTGGLQTFGVGLLCLYASGRMHQFNQLEK